MAPRWLVVLGFSAIMAACATTEVDPTEGWSAEQLYAAAQDEIKTGRYADAVGYLQKLEARYPFGTLAQQAQIDTAYAHYKDDERALALLAIDRFIRMHPKHPKLDYLYYLRGLVNFNERNSILSFLGDQDLSERDLEAARESFDSFKTLINRYPESKYVSDARLRMQYLVNSMAAGQVTIAKFYFDRGAHVAAANRAQEVVREYQKAPAVEDALAIMVRSYEALGLTELRDGALAVLNLNFPDSDALERTMLRDDRRWWQVWR